jgi:hypothetical protein
MFVTRLAFLYVLAATLAACAGGGHRVGSLPGPGLGPANLGAAGLASDQAQALRAAYGPPQLVRKEADAELWRYDGEHCAAFFFLYPVNGDLHVRFVETVPRGSDAPADAACLKSIRTRASATS